MVFTMQLDNQRMFPKKIIIPELLKDKLQLMANCDLSDREIDIFNVSLSCIEKQIQVDNINLNDFCKINVVFTKDGSFSFHENHFLYHTTSGPRPQESRALIRPASDDLQDTQGRWPHRRAGRDRPPIKQTAPPEASPLPDGFPYPLCRKRTHGSGC